MGLIAYSGKTPSFFRPSSERYCRFVAGRGSDGFMNLIVHEPATQLVNVLMAELPLPATGNVSAVCLQRGSAGSWSDGFMNDSRMNPARTGKTALKTSSRFSTYSCTPAGMGNSPQKTGRRDTPGSCVGQEATFHPCGDPALSAPRPGAIRGGFHS